MISIAPILFPFLLFGQTTPTGGAQAPKPAVARLTREDLETARKEVTEFFGSTAKGPDGKPIPMAERSAKLRAFAKDLLKDIDLRSIPAEDAGEWASLFSQAGMAEAVISLNSVVVETLSTRSMFAYSDLIPALIAAGREGEVLDIVRTLPIWQGAKVGQIAAIVLSAAKRRELDAKNPALVASWLDAFSSRLLIGPENAKLKGNAMNDYAYVDIQMSKLEMLYAKSRSKSILNQMAALGKRFASSKSTNAFGQSPSYRVSTFLTLEAAVGESAPELVADKVIGSFNGLGSLKGKVVLLDFMAHWCGPCKAALPKVRQWAKDFGPKGFTVLSVTSFYGYYGDARDVSPEDEFSRMRSFVKEYQMDWPVVFDAKQESMKRFRVGAIPHMVLIDKEGKIRKIQVGVDAKGEADLEALIQTLVSQPGTR